MSLNSRQFKIRAKSLLKRMAILIGCGSKTDEVKLHVSNDVEFMKVYLQSREGGYWLSSEIVVLINPNLNLLLSYFKDVKEDFRFVYYSGCFFSVFYS